MNNPKLSSDESLRISGDPLTPAQVDLEVSVLCASGLPKRRYYVVVTLDGHEVNARTQKSKKSSLPEWNESFVFPAKSNSALRLDVYEYHPSLFSKHRSVGSVEHSIQYSLSPASDVPQVYKRQILPSNAQIEFKLRVRSDHIEGLRGFLNDTQSIVTNKLPPKPTQYIQPNINTDGLGPVAQDLASVMGPLLERLKVFSDVMDIVTEIHPYAKMAWSILSGVYKIIQAEVSREDNIHALCKDLCSLYDLVVDDLKQKREQQKLADLPQRDFLSQMILQTTDCCYFIRSYVDHRFVKRTVTGCFSDVNQRIESYKRAILALRDGYFQDITAHTELVVIRVLNELRSIDAELVLRDMPYADGASLGPSKACMTGTRIDILEEIASWINSDDENASRVFFLSGAAGTGKSSIAHTVALRFDRLGRLGASFAFDRSQRERTPDKLFPTIAHDLADFDKGIREALYDVVSSKISLRTTSDLETQVQSFIIAPMKSLSISGPIVVVIDALDECGNVNTCKRLALLLARKMVELPKNFRILITSRSVDEAVTAFTQKPGIKVASMEGISPASTERDIRMYVRMRLLENEDGPLEGIDPGCCDQIVLTSQQLFQWASVACASIIGIGILGSTPRERYERLVQSGVGQRKTDLLDRLYLDILSQLFDSNDSLVMARFKSTLAAIMVALEPLTVQSLNNILHASSNPDSQFKVEVVVKFLGAVLSGVNNEDTVVRPLHSSFSDFLLDPNRSREYFIDTSITQHDFAMACLVIMHRELRFNICNLESSYLRNDEIHDIEDRKKAYISPSLAYACRYWGNHLRMAASLSNIHSQMIQRLEAFITEKFLFWLEVLSITKSVPVAARALDGMAKAVSARTPVASDLLFIAQEARRFVDTFVVAITLSAPHIYLSALPFTPQSSVISYNYLPKFSRRLTTCPSVGAWSPVENMLWADGEIRVITTFPDGSRIAIVTYDKALMWNPSFFFFFFLGSAH